MASLQHIRKYLDSRLHPYLSDLRTLTAIDSGSEHKEGVNQVQDWLQVRLEKMGCTVERYPEAHYGDHLLATLVGERTGKVVLLGHSDTVYPVGTGALRPLTINGDTILGPGTCDMKAGLLSGIYAMEALQQTGFQDFGTIAFLSVSDEETGERCSPPLIRQVSQGADAVLTLEAARENGDIVTARKAIAWYTLDARGRSAHAGVEPEKGRNAILGLAQVLQMLNQLNECQPGVTINIGTVEGGSRPSVVPDSAIAQLDLRAWSQADMDAAAAQMASVVTAAEVDGVSFSLRLQPDSIAPPLEYTPGVQHLEELAQSVAQTLGFKVNGARTGGSSDICFAAETGAPGLDGLGPIGGLDHGPDEYIDMSSIVPRTALLAGLIMKILG
ncbi:MAG: M20 family metallopeptidase [Chloroflexota bacterium]